MQKITPEINKEKLDRIVKATAIGSFGPNLELHGYKFQYNGEV